MNLSNLIVHIYAFIASCLVISVGYTIFEDNMKPLINTITEEDKRNSELQEVKTLVSEKTGISESEIIVKFNSHRKYDVFVGNDSYIVRTNRDNNAIKTFFKKRKE